MLEASARCELAHKRHSEVPSGGLIPAFRPVQDPDSDLTQPLLAPGRPVFGGRYILQAVLGTGGMGTVWRALEVSLRREVALKFLPLSVTRDEQAREDLKKEVLLSQELTHPNIIRVHNFEEDPLWAAISMEWVDGKSLNKLKAERPNSLFSVAELTPWIAPLCDALAYAHRLKIIHRDLKPANIMISARGQVKVVDFGIAASVSEANTRTLRPAVYAQAGTLVYMSPQQARGEKPTAADDIGVCQLLAEQHLFLEVLPGLFVACDGQRQKFQRDLPAQRNFERPPNRAHPSGAQHRL